MHTEYALTHRLHYMGCASELAASPIEPVRLMEFAMLSAHVPFERAVDTWLATADCHTMAELEAAHETHGMWPRQKVLWTLQLRESWTYPTKPYKVWRENVRLPGLGRCKQSFAACLIDPLGSDVVCLDTHMVRLYNGEVPEANWFRGRRRYEDMEAQLIQEAAQCAMPPFVYQWAVWDFQRGAISDHSFLWRL